jgi:hypothetical protein
LILRHGAELLLPAFAVEVRLAALGWTAEAGIPTSSKRRPNASICVIYNARPAAAPEAQAH